MDTSANAPVCPDWVFLNNSNVHVAKDRGWFKTYTPFASTITHSPFTTPGQFPVLGVGTVEIPTKRSPKRAGVASHDSLHLKEVLHVPDFICNVIGAPILSDGYNVILSGRSGTIKDAKGRNAAFFDPNRPLYTIKLRTHPDGPKLGSYALRKDTMYVLSCEWDAAQQRRWIEFNNRGAEAAHAAGTEPPYTAVEKAFLKAHWRDEYHFLLPHGLHIHKEEDRAEGRAILRSLMEAEETYDSDGDDEEFSDDESQFRGHQADYNFSEKQLEWIETHYGNSEVFMLSYGLKFYDDDDVEEAKAIANVMMADDDDE
ncbi:hypothetical protein C7974DRAFT_325674 [Boeremia exigua]|uniref:uncharacterized protein n=1 Tax=Boeremia exigua TaxID=749465 RepID=UPI001E8DF6F9|nr:uncharacterized protein C7974DRAFT_325674 [Boeremia exigua]KAH6644237.1 hypothetical protein C7974DRAFT_325674 [Boeremia exigua]